MSFAFSRLSVDSVQERQRYVGRSKMGQRHSGPFTKEGVRSRLRSFTTWTCEICAGRRVTVLGVTYDVSGSPFFHFYGVVLSFVVLQPRTGYRFSRLLISQVEFAYDCKCYSVSARGLRRVSSVSVWHGTSSVRRKRHGLFVPPRPNRNIQHSTYHFTRVDFTRLLVSRRFPRLVVQGDRSYSASNRGWYFCCASFSGAERRDFTSHYRALWFRGRLTYGALARESFMCLNDDFASRFPLNVGVVET